MIAALAGFLMGFISSMPIIGPISLLVFQRGMLARYRDGWAIGLGGAFVEGVYCALAVHGFSVLREGFTFLEPLAKGVGILLLLALGLYFMLVRQESHEESLIAEPPASHWAGQLCVGLSVAAFNPTPILTWSASVAMLHSIANLTFLTYDGIVFATSVVMGIVTWFSILLALLQRFRGHFPFSVLQRVIRHIGVGLVVIATVSAGWALFR